MKFTNNVYRKIKELLPIIKDIQKQNSKNIKLLLSKNENSYISIYVEDEEGKYQEIFFPET